MSTDCKIEDNCDKCFNLGFWSSKSEAVLSEFINGKLSLIAMLSLVNQTFSKILTNYPNVGLASSSQVLISIKESVGCSFRFKF